MSLCQTFKDLSQQTWKLLERARSVSHQPLEETITDNNIIDLKARHPSEILTTTYNKRQEAKTGADWEWWFTNNKKSLWFGVRVQAKILKFKTDRFEALHYKQQTDVLINDAQADGLVPLYCFYSQWPGSYKINLSGCRTYSNIPKNYGCALVDAYTIRANKSNNNSNTLSSVMANAYPWSCLVCCNGTIKDASGRILPSRVRSFIEKVLFVQHLPESPPLPSIMDNPPQHVLAILEGNDNIYEHEDPNLRGVMVIIDNDG